MRSMVPSSNLTRRIIPLLGLLLGGVDADAAEVKASSVIPVNRRRHVRHEHDRDPEGRRRCRFMVDVMVKYLIVITLL